MSGHPNAAGTDSNAESHLRDVIDSEKGITDEERLYGTKLMRRPYMPGAIECTG